MTRVAIASMPVAPRLDDRPYSTKELALRWNCSDQHIRDLVRTGAIRHFRVGRLIRIPAAAVEEHEARGQPAGEDEGLPTPAMCEKAAYPQTTPRVVKVPDRY